MAHLFISAAHKSSGKTTVSLGLCAALAGRGLRVAPFKKGPDYIDPMWLGLAAGRPCYNLDFQLMSRDEIVAQFARGSVDTDIAIVEGNKGLYDGLDLDGGNSNAALAKLLGAPVVLVLDARGMTRGIAPLILGYQAFDRDVNIAGVILNNLGGTRHESKLRAVIEHYTDVRVLGAVQHDPKLGIVERHLGLVPGNEADDARASVARIAQSIAAQCDLDACIELARHAAAPTAARAGVVPVQAAACVRIAIARDRAFGFYYQDDLDCIEAAGAVLVPFDALAASRLPEADGLIIGGGFPEMFLPELEANVGLRQDIARRIAAGLPTHAECGGLMYLSRSIRWQDRAHAMVGIIPGDVAMHERPVGRGYVRLQTEQGAEIHAHEFHYSSLDNLAPDMRFDYRVLRGHGVDGAHDGIRIHNLVASYCHMKNSAANPWAERFLARVRAHASAARAAA
jgi:cobyrinic acid a,c-diamide synthase